MYKQRLEAGEVVRRIAGIGLTFLGGCGVSILPNPGDSDDSRTTLNLTALGITDEDTYYETNPNDLFELAEVVDLEYGPRGIRGRINDTADVDVYDLGPVMPGDRLVITMESANSLDGAIALFDGDGTALLVNDHRNAYLGITKPYIDVVLQHGTDACFVAVSATPGFSSAGDYSLIASNEPDANFLPARPDQVLLDFTGGDNVRIGGRSPVDVPAFDASTISTDFAGQSSRIIAQVIEKVRQDYAGIDIVILSTSEGDLFESGMTRIYFGTYDQALLGVAEGVDEFNAARDQVAIVFVDTFAAFAKLDPAVEEISQALANVASHEIGHLLGLIHTDDPEGIMDVTAGLRELMEDQAFTRSPIYTAVFPLGYQSAAEYLLDVLGGDPELVFAKRLSPVRRKSGVQDFDPVPARGDMPLSGCSLASH